MLSGMGRMGGRMGGGMGGPYGPGGHTTPHYNGGGGGMGGPYGPGNPTPYGGGPYCQEQPSLLRCTYDL